VRVGSKAKYVALVGLGKADKLATTAEWGASPFQVCVRRRALRQGWVLTTASRRAHLSSGGQQGVKPVCGGGLPWQGC